VYENSFHELTVLRLSRIAGCQGPPSVLASTLFRGVKSVNANPRMFAVFRVTTSRPLTLFDMVSLPTLRWRKAMATISRATYKSCANERVASLLRAIYGNDSGGNHAGTAPDTSHQLVVDGVCITTSRLCDTSGNTASGDLAYS